MIVVVAAMIVMMIVAMIVPETSGIAVMVMIRAVIVVDVAAVAIPVSRVKLIAVVTRIDPARAFIGWPRPIPGVPYVAAAYRIPIPVDPDEFGSRPLRNDANDARRRRRPNPDADGKLCGAQRGDAGEQQHREECTSNENFHKVTLFSALFLVSSYS